MKLRSDDGKWLKITNLQNCDRRWEVTTIPTTSTMTAWTEAWTNEKNIKNNNIENREDEEKRILTMYKVHHHNHLFALFVLYYLHFTLILLHCVPVSVCWPGIMKDWAINKIYMNRMKHLIDRLWKDNKQTSDPIRCDATKYHSKKMHHFVSFQCLFVFLFIKSKVFFTSSSLPSSTSSHAFAGSFLFSFYFLLKTSSRLYSFFIIQIFSASHHNHCRSVRWQLVGNDSLLEYHCRWFLNSSAHYY